MSIWYYFYDALQNLSLLLILLIIIFKQIKFTIFFDILKKKEKTYFEFIFFDRW